MSFWGSVSCHKVKRTSQVKNMDIKGERYGRVLVFIVSNTSRTVRLRSVALVFIYNKTHNL